MKHICRILSLVLALLMLMSAGLAEAADHVVALVNGEELMYSTYYAIESTYLYQYEAAGMDLTDPTVYAYVQDLALSHAIEQMLVVQDMREQGCYDFDDATEVWCVEQGNAAYEQALRDVGEMLRDSLGLVEDEDVKAYALDYAASMGVTAESYIDVYRTQYASAKYQEWLIRDNPVTEADVQAEYDARVAASRELHGTDAAAFEQDAASGNEVWYRPAGYRSVLQILLSAQGDTAEAKLAAVQGTVDEISARLVQGESFEQLIREYGTDASFNDEEFFGIGYQVHPDSVIWEDAFVQAAFAEDMAAPGCWSQPFASDLGVHILYYLSDVPEGPIELTGEIYDALAYVIYATRTQAAQKARIEELAAAAEVIFY